MCTGKTCSTAPTPVKVTLHAKKGLEARHRLVILLAERGPPAGRLPLPPPPPSSVPQQRWQATPSRNRKAIWCYPFLLTVLLFLEANASPFLSKNDFTQLTSFLTLQQPNEESYKRNVHGTGMFSVHVDISWHGYFSEFVCIPSFLFSDL